jgi:signal transduction histidine kinase
MEDRATEARPEGQRLARVGLVPLLGGYALAHALATACGYALIPSGLSQAIFWPAMGLLLAVLVAVPTNRWPALLVTAIGAEVAAGLVADVLAEGVPVALGWRLFFPVTNALVSVAGAQWIRLVVGWPPQPSLRALTTALLGAAAASAAGAFVGALGVFFLNGQPFVPSFQLWWTSDLLGIVAVVPALLGLLVRPVDEGVAHGRIEAVVLWVLGGVLTVLVFGQRLGGGLFQVPYVLFPLFIWAGVRFPPLHVALFGLAFAFLASVMTKAGMGPFAEDARDLLEAVAPLQYFLVVTLVSALALARAVDDHRRTIVRLEATGGMLRKTARELVSVEEMARRGIAQDLHDGLAQVIAGLRMMLAPLVANPRRDDADQILGQARTMLSEAESETRSLLADLNPPGLDDAGLFRALEILVDRLHGRHGLEVSLDAEGGVEALASGRRALLFRLAAELLMNVAKHAGVSQAGLQLETGAAGDRLVVIDRGEGFDPSAPVRRTTRGGMGLASVHERVAALGGTVEIRSAPGEGCRVEVWLPPAGA